MEATTVEQALSAWTRARFAGLYPDADLSGVALEVVSATEEKFGEYQCNAAMGLSKILRKPPREIATAFAAVEDRPEWLERIEVAGPGFLNFHLRTDWLARRLERVEGDDRLGTPDLGGGSTVVLDYSSPNIAKPMHIGHIRSTVIGNALDRMHRFLGYRVIADNHLGDWGTQFGILIMGYRSFLNPEALAADPIAELERIYVQSYERSRAEASWLDQARAELVKLQQGDAENLAVWKKFVELSLGEFDRIYRRLGVSFDLTRGESHYNDALPGVIADLVAQGLAVESEGALVVKLEEEKLPVCLVRKSDGAANYATTDLATIRSRIAEFAPERIIYVTDERQQTHFKQVFAVCRRAGWTANFVHVWFGLMRLPEGTFSTRQGNVIKLELLLDEAERRARDIVEQSNPALPEDVRREVARAVGIGAVKYADLSQNPQSLVTFSWDKALALEGNSAPYLQYAYARIASVRDKYAEQFPGQDFRAPPIVLGEPIERRLAVKLVRFPDVVAKAAAMYRPNILCDYLFDLAQAYSSFYQNVPFLKAEAGVRDSRVRLCDVVARTLRKGLELIGVEAPDRI